MEKSLAITILDLKFEQEHFLLVLINQYSLNFLNVSLDIVQNSDKSLKFYKKHNLSEVNRKKKKLLKFFSYFLS